MSTHPTDPKEPPRAAAPAAAEDHWPAPVQPGLPLPPGASAQVSAASPRRSAGTRLRQAAASSMLAAVSVTGVGAAAAQAGEPQEAAWFVPAEDDGAMSAVPGPAAVAQDSAERLAGVRRDLADAVAWGSVSASQAEHFYSQISARIARGL